MLIIAVDDEKIALEGLINTIKKAEPTADVYGFNKSCEAIKFMEENPKICDIAFLDIEMNYMNGLELSKILKSINCDINIIFTTGHDEYLSDAFKIHASGYIMKPITVDKVRNELIDLRRPLNKTSQKLLKVQCFGTFEVFANGKPLKFSRSKTKEMFAYMVDRRGASLNTKQLCTVLWEDKLDTPTLHNQLRTLISDLRSTLKQVNAEEVFVSSRNSFAIDPSKLDCDYYLFCDGKYNLKIPFEYMAQYSWTELTNATISQELKCNNLQTINPISENSCVT